MNEPDDYVNSPSDGWRMVDPRLSGGASAPDFYLSDRESGRFQRRHGEAVDGHRSPEYRTWTRIITRCQEGARPFEVASYWARGITVCARWRADYLNFLADMGRRPSARHQIDRIDNDKGYEPGNCRWATPRENTNNRRVTRRLDFRGENLPLTVWAERYGLEVGVLHFRLHSGWPVERALTEAVRPRRKRSVAAESKAHAVSDGEPKQAGASDARMMRAAIPSDPWLLLTSGR